MAMFPTPKGSSKHPLYSTWNGMMNRCHNPKFCDFATWGGRGIDVCPEWHNFTCFVKDMHPKPTLTHEIDRVDNNKGYSKENCRWVTRKENTRNKRNTRYITIGGVTRCLSEWAEVFGMALSVFQYRFNAGWDIQKIVETPVRYRAPNWNKRPREVSP